MENDGSWLNAKKHKYDDSYVINHTRIPGVRAQYAMDLAKHIGIAFAAPDGEDSSGRQKMKVLTPDEVARRACEISDSIFAIFDSRGWILDLPHDAVPPAGSP